MKNNFTFLLFACFIACPGVASAACSQLNLTRCLDSVCAINVSSNPAARCQYCGTADAGTPSKSAGGMRSLSLGVSAKYTLSEDELEDAPTDPGQRYAWATIQCLDKVEGCTPDDVSDTYDELIEQSCRAAGVSAQMTATISNANKQTVSSDSCLSTIRSCLVAANKCGGDYRACEDDSSFNNFFSACSVEATGCSDYISSIRDTLTAARDSAIQNADQVIQDIVKSHQTAREQKITAAQTACKNNSGRESCIESVCQRSMPNKCENGGTERANAELLCKFYDLACDMLN